MRTARTPMSQPAGQDLLRRQAAQLAELREVLVAVAQALERLAVDEPSPARRRILQRHAMRLRHRLWRLG